jgi:HlyD family secretion protein
MTTVDIITKTKYISGANKCRSVKSDTSAVSDVKVEPSDDKNQAPKSDKKSECL